MTREEFVTKYRPRLLLFVTEAWAVRREDARTLALALDGHHQDLRRLLGEMWADFNPPPEPAKAANGQQANGRATR